jgi:hypothetical protein
MQESVTRPDADLTEQIRAFRDAHPEVNEALELFNVSYAEYAATVAAQQSVTTYVTTHTLMPGERA